MYKKRHTFEKVSEDESNIVNFIDYQDNEYKIPINIYNTEEEVVLEDNNTIKSILNLLDQRSRFVVESYFGFDGHSLTLKEIGSVLNLSESFVSRIFRKAISLLKEYLTPDFERTLRNLFAENKSFVF